MAAHMAYSEDLKQKVVPFVAAGGSKAVMKEASGVAGF